MKKFTCLDTAPMPDGATISLHEHDGSYSVRVSGIELMSTRHHSSEEKLAELACAHVGKSRGARILIGGLGLGFTLRAALKALAGDASVTVAEISDAIIRWNRNPSYPLASDVLADARVTLIEKDVGEVIRATTGGFDSIALDVDNGPDALCSDGNSRLYDAEGLRRARAALRKGGCLAIWSALPDPAFEKALARAGFAGEVQRCRAHGNSGSRHAIFLGFPR